MRVSVVGGGLFGCTAAIYLARAGHDVSLFEQHREIMTEASGINQFRLHEGYHYPRSPETARACRAANVSFRAEYGAAVIDDGDQFYAIAGGSRTSPDLYMDFVRGMGLKYVSRPTLRLPLLVRATEGRIDPLALRRLVHGKLKEAGVTLYRETRAPASALERSDMVVIAAYAATNRVASMLGLPVRDYQFEVVEKLVVKAPGLENTGIVVMDGPFCSVDPWGATGLHLVGHVEHAIHSRNVGPYPVIPDALRGCFGPMMIGTQPSHRNLMLDAAAEFIPAMADAEYRGSFYVVRMVLPDVDATDERPTLVEPIDPDGRVLRVFSGKLGTCVEAARQVVAHAGRARMAA